MTENNAYSRKDFNTDFLREIFDGSFSVTHIPEYKFISGLTAIINYMQEQYNEGNGYPFGLDCVDTTFVNNYLEILRYSVDNVVVGQYNLKYFNEEMEDEVSLPITLEKDLDRESVVYSLSYVNEYGTLSVTYTETTFKLYYSQEAFSHNLRVKLEGEKVVSVINTSIE